MKMLNFILLAFFSWRIFLFIPLIFSNFFLSYRSGFEYTNIVDFAAVKSPLNHFLIYPWSNFDGIHYLLIAGKGYTESFGFFPLYPSFIWLSTLGLGETFGIVRNIGALLISNLAFFLSLIIFYKLLLLDYDHTRSKKTILFLLFFPTSFFFTSLYTETLFFLLSVSTFYFLRKERWFLAGICAAFLSVTRVVGISIVLVLAYELIVRKKFIDKLYITILPVISLGFYSFYNFIKTGDFFKFIKAHGEYSNNRSIDKIILFPQTIFRYFKILLTVDPHQFEYWIALLELISFFFAASLLFIAWKKRIRASYLLFSILCFLIPISTGTFTSLPRYILVLFPIFIALSFIKNRFLERLYMIAGGILLSVLLSLFSKGYFVA